MTAVLVAMAFASQAWAGLGGIAVRSNLGEAFRADIALSGYSDAELAALRVGLASADTFRDLNIDYDPAVGALGFNVVRQGGKSYVRVFSRQPINDPYLRFVVEARTPGGRSVREYTVLLDPADYPLRQPVLEQDLPRTEGGSYARPRASQPLAAHPGTIRVAPGQSLHQIASQVRPEGATLRQTMAALLRDNPSAFIDGNPDKVRSGALLRVPDASRISRLSQSEARGLLHPAAPPPAPVSAPEAAHPAPAPTPPAHKDAAPAKMPPTAPAKPGAAASEALTLSAPEGLGSAQSQRLSALEQEIANRDRSLHDAERRIAELEQKLKQILKLQGSAPVGAPPAAAPTTPTEVGKGVPPPAAGPGLLARVMGMLPLIAGGAAALALAGALLILARRRRKAASAGKTKTKSTGPAVSVPSMVLGAGNSLLTDFTRSGMGSIDAGEVDPIAEAEVYLAYGREKQAEDILNDALSKDPTRHEVRLKLMEIYAARQDKGAFEQAARALYAVVDGQGPAWAKAAAMGLAFDPHNPLYGGSPAPEAPPAEEEPLADLAGPELEPAAPEPPAPAGDIIDIDSELLGDMPPAAPPKAPPAAELADVGELLGESRSENPEAEHHLDFDMDALLSGTAEEAAQPQDKKAEEPKTDPEHMLDFDFQLGGGAAPGEEAVGELDLSSMPESELEAPPVSGVTVNEEPLLTKMDLAKVYIDMGDKDGAREVLEELVAEAEGPLKDQAQRLLDSL